MKEQSNDARVIQELQEKVKAIKGALSKKIVGQQVVIDDLLACFLSGGHCIITGVPGLAKTMLVQNLARCLDLQFNRVQFTPDLMPSDITGSEILVEDKATGAREFKFVKGPVFSNIVLADEINRTPPKTQSALLQAMQESEVTSSGVNYKLPVPFWVLATQNPIEQEGTYPLPEAQQDRFMFSIEIGYPDEQSELEIARSMFSAQEVDPVVDAKSVMKFRELLGSMPVADSVVKAAVTLVRSSRPDSAQCPSAVKKYLSWGAGPRASQFLVLAAKSYALLDGRATPDKGDIKRAAYPVLRHRIVRSFHGDVDGVGSNDIIKVLLEKSCR
ncbi:MoxR family ATPase [Chitinispirillales bacterium ANBcel5]|uniref:AAA family ATPase n=1 Tax=Cellulosispirillum alkaliphilum TaxID=3039283 RepID=UPI002A539CB9|nr:MoxR family ATPase [Chitinispirillales bacterium ANBcel5]